jgi:glucose-1-phosphate cytidylyltransferase
MKAVILAGGLGTRISEETVVRPKPMVEIGGKPILWHIMKLYTAHGITEFVICLGYKGYVIKEFFANYFLHTSDVRFDMRSGRMEVLSQTAEPWTVTLVDTGEASMTGGRLLRAREHIGDETFCMTYGDGLSDVDITALIAHHREAGALATLTAVQPPGRFGALAIDGGSGRITSFGEKRDFDGAWVNGGFFVLEPAVLDVIDDEQTMWERAPLERLSARGDLSAYRHGGYWYAMDTLADKAVLEREWASGAPPWRTW